MESFESGRQAKDLLGIASETRFGATPRRFATKKGTSVHGKGQLNFPSKTVSADRSDSEIAEDPESVRAA